MTVIGSYFTKMQAERKSAHKGKINVKNNISIKDVKESDMQVDKSKKTLKFVFKFLTNYEPDLGKIELDGEILFLIEEKKAKDILDNWKNKKLDKESSLIVLNHALDKCNVESLILSREINLPAPVKLPKFDPKK